MIRKHFRKRLVLGLAFAAVLVPTAQAKTYLQSSAPQQPVASEMSVQSSALSQATTPVRSEISVQAPGAQLKIDRDLPGITAAGAALANQQHTAFPVPVTVASSTGSDGFNWSDAGIGASVTFGALLLLLTAVMLGRRQRSRGLASV